MEWWLASAACFGSLLFLLLTGFPVAFCFLTFNFVGAIIVFGGEAGLRQLVLSILDSATMFSLLPVVMFLIMGEVMFASGVAFQMLNTLDKLLGRLPGRLALLTVAGGALLSVMSGFSSGTAALLGSTLTPDMERRGYKKSMSLGPVLGSGGLAMMIPPSTMVIIYGALAEVSIGRLLIAIVIPGVLMAVLYASYITVRCWLQPSVAPPYEVARIPIRDRIMSIVRHILPLGFIVFLVLGLIFFGVASPTESAAMGALGCCVLAASHKRLNWLVVKKSFLSTVRISVMLFMIITGSKAFSQILAFTAGVQGLVRAMIGLPLPPMFLLIGMQVMILFLGAFLDPISIVMISVPIYMPVVYTLGFNPLWFSVVMLINLEMGLTSPPFGTTLFVVKSIAPAGTTMGDCYRAGLPFLGCDAVAMILLIAFPILALWLPGIMR